MSDDAREKLAAEAERLRQQRLDQAAAEERAGAASIARVQADRKSFSGWRMTKSLTHLAILAIGLCCWVAAWVGYFEKAEPSETPPTETGLLIGKILFWTLIGAGAFFVGLQLSARARFERWRRALPFALEGTDLLGLGEAVTEAQLTIAYSDTTADEQTFTELVTARLKETTVVKTTLVAKLDRQGSNYPMGQWLRAAVNTVLRDVHAAYPIRTVTLSAVKTEEFYIPSD